MSITFEQIEFAGEHSSRPSSPGQKRSRSAAASRQDARRSGADAQPRAAIRDPARLVDAASRAFAVVKAVPFVVALLLLLWNIGPADRAVRSLFELAPHVKQFTAGVVSIVFDEQSIARVLPPLLEKGDPLARDPAYFAKLSQIIRDLRIDEYRRLMLVGQAANLCEYTTPSTVEMQHDVTLDIDLEAKGLVVLKDSPETLARITAKMDDRPGRSPNGYPRYCYAMSFTKLGANVKSALTETIGAGLEDHLALN